CPACASELAPGAPGCPVCGAGASAPARRCSACGASVDRADAFCPTCFVALDPSRGKMAVDSTPIVTAHVCPACSTRNPPGAERCTSCGAPLARPAPAAAPAAARADDLVDAPADVALEEIADESGGTQFDQL